MSRKILLFMTLFMCMLLLSTSVSAECKFSYENGTNNIISLSKDNRFNQNSQTITPLMLRNENTAATQSTSESNHELKEKVYSVLDGFNISTYSHDYYYIAPAYYFPATYYSQEAYDLISQYGIMSVPDILRYIMEHESYDNNALKNHAFLLLSAYEMLGVKAVYGSYEIYWICPDSITDMSKASFGHVYLLAQALLDHINEHGVRPLYAFTSKQEASESLHIIQYTLVNARFYWNIERNLSHYQDEATLITVFGEYAVPYILDYILSHEGQSLTPDEEMNLGVLLHCAYNMLDVETTAEWHMPAESVASTTDPFPYARELTAHLGEYGLEPVP